LRLFQGSGKQIAYLSINSSNLMDGKLSAAHSPYALTITTY
jgi:hypothetical protein